MNIKDFVDFVAIAVEAHDDGQGISNIRTFDDVGMLTRNEGLVITLTDGSEFQVTIIQSEYAEDDKEE